MISVIFIACVASASLGFSARLRHFFSFWRRKNWGERNTDGRSGEGEDRREKETLARKPHGFEKKNHPFTLSQLDVQIHSVTACE